MKKGGAPEAAKPRSSATRSSSTSRPPSINLHCSPSRATASAALEFTCSRRVYDVMAAAWWEALAADRACRIVRAVAACPRRPRPAAPCGLRAARGVGLPGASGSAWAG